MRKVKQTSFQQIFEFYNSKKEPDINDCNDNNTPLFQDYNGKLLIHDNNFNALKNLLNKGYAGKVDLVYIDPPFGIGKKFENKKSGIAFDDKVIGSEYLQFMYERLILLRELLSDQGSIYLHCDWHKSHHLRFLLDEVFGEENFVNEVVWKYTWGMRVESYWNRKHDTILMYSKNGNIIFNASEVLEERQISEATANRLKYKGAMITDGNKGRGSEELALPTDVWSDISVINLSLIHI